MNSLTYFQDVKCFVNILLAIFSLYLPVHAQTNIGGIVNIYTPVTAFGNCNSLEVASSTGFSDGDRILIIQMKGATIDQSNNVNFGTVSSIGDAGNYEFGTVSSISGNTIFLVHQLINSYTVSGKVQLIRVPQYTDAIVTTQLTAQNWNGTTGGVLVIEVANILTLQTDINTNGKGFHGGAVSANYWVNGDCATTDYIMLANPAKGAFKGEGITEVMGGMQNGRGALANGGGGGNNLNAGGGGGGNYGVGGRGGNEWSGCSNASVGGNGGKSLNFSNRVFLGGGGGGGHQNNSVSTSRGHGGGIIIIRAGSIIGNNNIITSNGNSVSSTAGIDAAGGGGGGGTIILNSNNIVGNLSVTAKGGNGGNTNNGNSGGSSGGQCHGPGAGGGGGYIGFSNSSIPISATVQTNFGIAGINSNSQSSCFNSSYGAQNGNIGATESNVQIPESSIVWSPGNLTATLTNPTCNGGNDGQIDIIYTGSNYTVSWTPNVSSGLTASGLVAGAYQVSISEGANCTYNQTFVIENPLPIYLDVEVTSGTCGSSNGQINVTPLNGVTPYSFNWNSGQYSSAQINNLVSGSYSVVVTDNLGCVADTSIILDNSGTPPPPNVASPIQYCEGQSASALTANGQSSLTLTWYSTIGAPPLANTPFPNTNSAGSFVYYVTQGLQEGCESLPDSITIIVSSNPVVQVSDTTVCTNQSVILSAMGADSYTWIIGNDTTMSATLSTNISTTTLVHVIGFTGGCSDSAQFVVSVFPNIPPSYFIFESDSSCFKSVTVANTTPNSYVNWYFNNTHLGTDSLMGFNSINQGILQMEVTDANGCITSVSIPISPALNGFELFIPNIFTHNNDGVNDGWHVIPNCLKSLKCTIFNRWGQQMAYYDVLDFIWDGNNQENNKEVPDGVYFYIIDAVDFLDQVQNFTGSVTKL